MRLSLSIQKEVLKTAAGRLLNTFQIFPRRIVLFSEDILAQYVLECENAGYSGEMFEIGKKWAALGIALVPPPIRILPPEQIVNFVLKKVWANLGLIDDLHVVRSGEGYQVSTRGEFITRIIGKNSFMRGACVGVAVGLHKCDFVCTKSAQGKESSYFIRKRRRPFGFAGRDLGQYASLNGRQKAGGISLKDAIDRGVFQLGEGNRVSFRGKGMVFMENTLFHIIGMEGPLISRIPAISASFFRGIVADVSEGRKLVLLKTIIEASGWGRASIKTERRHISFFIGGLPYGLQAEEDSWTFLSYFILGFLRIVYKKSVLEECRHADSRLFLKYAVS